MQKRAAFLLTLSRRKASSHAESAALDAETDALQIAVEAYTEALAQQLAQLSDDIRNHGRIVDTVRALKSVHSILAEARLGFVQRIERPTVWSRTELGRPMNVATGTASSSLDRPAL